MAKKKKAAKKKAVSRKSAAKKKTAVKRNPPKLRPVKKSTGWIKATAVRFVRRGGTTQVLVRKPAGKRKKSKR